MEEPGGTPGVSLVLLLPEDQNFNDLANCCVSVIHTIGIAIVIQYMTELSCSRFTSYERGYLYLANMWGFRFYSALVLCIISPNISS